MLEGMRKLQRERTQEVQVMQSLDIFKCMADETRFRCLVLLEENHELEGHEIKDNLTAAKAEVQSILEELCAEGFLVKRLQGDNNYFRLRHDLPGWLRAVLRQSERQRRAQGLPKAPIFSRKSYDYDRVA